MQMEPNVSTGLKKSRLGTILAVIAFAVLLIGGGWFATHHATADKADMAGPMSTMSGMAGPAPASSARTSGKPTEVQIDLAPDDLKKAQLHTAQAAMGSIATSLRVPGIVAADEYTEVHVTPLAGGLVKQVPVILGDHVRRGQPLAVIFSSELAEAEAAFLADLAVYEADHQKLERTQTLLKLGAASQQEEEEVTATQAGHQARVQASRARLNLLGANDHQIAALEESRRIDGNLIVPAPIGGVVLLRAANLGQVATPAQELFTVADLAKVWILASVNEKDFASVRVGSPAAITAAAYPGRTWRGRVVYIQPQVDATTRTAQARIEVANTDQTLRLAMYMDVDFATEIARGLVVPQTAVQAIGDKECVFLPLKDSDGSFAVRPVQLGSATSGNRSVLSGLGPGDAVVTEGSFLLKAEAIRQHPELQ